MGDRIAILDHGEMSNWYGPKTFTCSPKSEFGRILLSDEPFWWSNYKVGIWSFGTHFLLVWQPLYDRIQKESGLRCCSRPGRYRLMTFEDASVKKCRISKVFFLEAETRVFSWSKKGRIILIHVDCFERKRYAKRWSVGLIFIYSSVFITNSTNVRVLYVNGTSLNRFTYKKNR